MSKSRRVEKLKERSQERFNKWADSNTPMDKFEGSRAQKDLKEHHRLRHKVERIEGKIQAKKDNVSSETKEKPKPTATSKASDNKKSETASTKMVGSNKGTAVTSAFAKIEEAAKKRREAAAEDKVRRQELRAKRDAKSAKAGSWVQGIVGLQGFAGSKKS